MGSLSKQQQDAHLNPGRVMLRTWTSKVPQNNDLYPNKTGLSAIILGTLEVWVGAEDLHLLVARVLVAKLVAGSACRYRGL